MTPIVAFARAPEPGRAKTRLSGALGEEGAAQIAAAFLRDTWSSLRAIPWVRPVIATTAALDDRFSDIDTWDQGEGDLGERMERMLRRALTGAPAALALGTDTPGLPSRMLAAARMALTSADAVLGPCDDGGFYLLGLKRCPPGLLADIAWSQPDTLVRVRERLRARGLSVALAPPWFDVDEPADLARLDRMISASYVDAPATSRALARLPQTRTVPPGSHRISIVIPTLDEAARIARRLDELAVAPGIAEVIVVDGGSRDHTVSIARSFCGVRVLEAPRGRGIQLNRGAAAATGDVILFLHADVALPADAADFIREALSDDAVVAGAFRTWTRPDTGPSRLGPLLHLADIRSRYTSLPYGDQALFVRTDAFRAVGGFLEIPIMEDLELALSLRRLGLIRTVQASVTVSARRFLARPVYYTLLVNVLPLLLRLGVSPARLAGLYGDPR